MDPDHSMLKFFVLWFTVALLGLSGLGYVSARVRDDSRCWSAHRETYLYGPGCEGTRD